MEVKVRYLSVDIANQFGSEKQIETLNIPDDAKYEHLLSLFSEKWKENNKEQSGKMKEGVLGTFVFISNGKNLRRIKDERVNPESEVLVAYADTGG